MKSFKKNITGITIAATVLSLSSCGGSSPQAGNPIAETAIEVEKAEVEKEVEEFIYPLPTPFKLTQMLNDIGASFILSLANPAENAGKYITEQTKAVNLGIYGSDLSYASVYNQKQSSIDYLNVSNQLVEELNFAEATNKHIVERVEKNEDNRDSLVSIISDTFYKTYSFLNENNRPEVALYILAGSWVEGLYIATHISENTYDNINMVKIIMNQKEPLNKLMEMLEAKTGDAGTDELIKDLSPVHEIFAGMQEGSITRKQVRSITEEIAKVRNKYTAIQ